MEFGNSWGNSYIHASFHLRWKENLVKYQKVFQYYVHDCGSISNALYRLWDSFSKGFTKQNQLVGIPCIWKGISLQVFKNWMEVVSAVLQPPFSPLELVLPEPKTLNLYVVLCWVFQILNKLSVLNSSMMEALIR